MTVKTADEHAAMQLPTSALHRWQSLIFDLDTDDRDDFQRVALENGTDPSVPITRDNSPGLHARLCKALKDAFADGVATHPDFTPFEFNGLNWTPSVRCDLGNLSEVDFSLCDEFAGMVETFEASASRRTSITPNDVGKKPAKPAAQPRGKGGKFGSKKR